MEGVGRAEGWLEKGGCKRWKEEGVRSESGGAAVQADPGAGTQVLARGRPLEERTHWPAIGSCRSSVGRWVCPRSQAVWSVPEPYDPPESSEPHFFGLAAGPLHST